jgi:predicted alpha/beta hydrolase family esterase
VPQARRVDGIDWERPVLADWAAAVGHSIDTAPGPVLVVAHSFGCLASVCAAARRAQRVAGLMLVAPADPERFAPAGLREEEQDSISHAIPTAPGHPSLVVASTNDPWVRLSSAAYWADNWGGLAERRRRRPHQRGFRPRPLAPGPGAARRPAATCDGSPWATSTNARASRPPADTPDGARPDGRHAGPASKPAEGPAAASELGP